MYIQELAIENLRCFARTELSLSTPLSPGEFSNVNVVLGGNRAGKTTLLRALAIGLISPALPSSGFIPFQLVRFDTDGQAKLELEVRTPASDGTTRLTTFITEKGDRESISHWQAEALWEPVLDDNGSAFFLCGYSAERQVAKAEGWNDERFSRRYKRIASLFEYQTHYLSPIHKLWEDALPNQLDTVQRHINGLLPDDLEVAFVQVNRDNPSGKSRDRIQMFEGRRIAYLWRGQEVDFTSLSDGYRAFLGWVADVWSQLLKAAGEEDPLSLPGVVLVDEVDLHLHPEWQRTVVPAVSKAFPALQFVFTTHSPLVAASVPSERLLVMDMREEDGSSYVRRGHESLYGKMAHQVLQSEYFGLSSTRDETFEEDLQQLWEEAATGKNPDAALKIQQMLATPERRP